jgi:hypothetical protein
MMLLFAACGGSSEPAQLVDAFDDRPSCQFFVCFDHTIWKLQPQRVDDQGFCPPADFIGVEEAGTCEHGCRDNALAQSTDAMCIQPPLAPLACRPTGTCTQNETQDCEATFDCNVGITFGSCACNQQAWECTPACKDGICGPSAMQQAIAGTWLGTVTPTQIPMAPYTVTLEIAANGDWRATSEPGTWNLGGGGTAGSTIFIEAQTSAGAYGTMRVHGYMDMPLFALRFQGSRLQGTIAHDCDSNYAFDLQRIQ